MNQYVAFSGGIDSTALALKMPDAVPVFTDTGWEFDELYAHIERFERKTGREVIRTNDKKYPAGIPEYIRIRKFMPNHRQRYCTRKFKIEALNKWIKDRLPATLNIALRADENRAGNLTIIGGLTISYPLQEWGIDRMGCVQTCIDNDLLPRYPVYMARGGCKGCFYKRKSEVYAMQELAPNVLDELQELEEITQDERGKFFYMFSNIEMSIRDFRRQASMFTPDQIYQDASDTSDYGIACGLFCNR